MRGRSRELLLTAAWVAAVLLLVALAGRLTSQSLPAGPRPAGPAGPAARAAGSVQVTRRITLPARPQQPPWDDVSGLAGGAGALWAARCDLLRVDPLGTAPVATVAGTGRSAAGCVRGVAAAAGMVWAAVPRVGLLRIDPAPPAASGVAPAAASRVGARVPVAGIGASVALTAGAVWAVCCPSVPGEPPPPQAAGGTLVRVDPRRARVVGRTRLGAPPTAVAAGPGGLWVAGVGRLWRVDPGTGRVLASLRDPADLQAGGRLTVAAGAVWVATAAGGLVLRVDPGTARVVGRFAGAIGVRAAAAGARVWVPGVGGLLPLDRSSGPGVVLDGVDLLAITDLAAGWGALWVLTWDQLVRVDPGRLG